MKQRPLTLLLAATTLLYAACTVPLAGWPENFWGWRHELMLLSGVQLMAVMSAAMLLAMRLVPVEQALGGLDKLYALHKRLGIAAGVLLSAHWLIKLSPKLLLALQWVEPRVKRGGAKDPLVSLAKDMGEWAAWAVLALVVLALLRAVPYGFWRKLHKLFAPLYLVGAFHGVVLMPAEQWATPLGWLMGALMAAGAGCALWSLGGRIGKARRFAGTVSRVTPLAGGQFEVVCRLGDAWPGHVAGQFALVSFDAGEGAHPFTIASASRADGELRFIIKALGDYTQSLAARLRAGAPVAVEGPYGCFDARRGGRRQAWVAGGIGVTPFLAWLDAGRPLAPGQEVDFYYCVRKAADAARLDELTAACARSGVRLHVIESDAGALLDATQIPDVDDLWFCGPRGLGEALRTQLGERGAQAPAFHHEAFSMR